MTKEVDLEHLVHAGFDPEAAAHEDGLDPEDLGYDEEDSGAPPPPPPPLLQQCTPQPSLRARKHRKQFKYAV